MAMVSFGCERHLPSLVVSKFQTGIQFIDKLMTALQVGDYNFKQHIKNACASFSKAECELEKHIRRQTKKCREEEAELSNMQRRHQEILRSLAGMKDSLESLSKTLEEQRKKVKSAQSDVKDSEARVRKEQSKYEDAIATRNGVEAAGWATIWVPVVGASLLLVSETALKKCVDNAEHCLESTKSNLSRAEDAVREMTKARENTQGDIKKREMEKTKMKNEMVETQKNISTYRKDINEQNRTLTSLRKVMTRLGKVSGRAEVLRDATAIMHDIAEIGIPLKSLFDSFEEFITQPDLWKKVLSRPEFLAVCDDDDGDW
ncbi:structural maintenance of chromosomes protein 4-like [Haliotis cracherodii]|uniref:structural maintenance of chromosomes protein 4-like n=1 Tax=Haliotis cracherodii TaxID=6455 RepID=UPI0039ED64ED